MNKYTKPALILILFLSMFGFGRTCQKRQELVAMRCIDVQVMRDQFAALWAVSQLGETFSATGWRMIEAISGNWKSAFAEVQFTD